MPVDRSTLDRRRTPPPPPRTLAQQHVAALLGHSPVHDEPPPPRRPPYHPAVPSHDNVARSANLARTRAASIQGPPVPLRLPHLQTHEPLNIFGQPSPTGRLSVADQIRDAQILYGGHVPKAQQQAARQFVGKAQDSNERLMRALPVAQSGIPLQQVAGSVLSALRGLDASTRTGVIAGFPNNSVLNAKSKATLARQYHLPPNPSDQEALRALFNRHSSYASDVGHNLVTGALHAPVGIFAGAYASGKALEAAATGNTKPAQEIYKGTLAYATDPKEMFRRDPFSYLLAGHAVLRGAGALAGKQMGLQGGVQTITPRNLSAERVLPGGGIEEVTREVPVGNFSRNALVYGAQRLKGRLTEGSQRSSDLAVGRASRQVTRLTDTERDVAIRNLVKPVLDRMHRASKTEQKAALAAHGQNVTPGELRSFYEGRIPELEEHVKAAQEPTTRAAAVRELRAVRGAAKDWAKIEKKVGNEPSPAMSELLDSYRGAVRTNERQLQAEGLLDPAVAIPREHLPRDVIAPDGPAVGRLFDLDQREASLRSGLKSAGPIESDVIETALGHIAEARQRIIGSTGPTADPVYFPHRQPRSFGRSIAALRGSSSSANRIFGHRFDENTGTLLRQGRIDIAPTQALKALAEPNQALYAARHMADQKAKFAIPGEKGMLYDPQRLVAIKQEVPVSPGSSARTIVTEGLLDNPEIRGGQAILPEGYDLLPKQIADQLRGRFASTDQMSGLQQAGHTLTNAFRWWALTARPAWLVSNIVGNTTQALLAGAGPVSGYRALEKERSLRVPGTSKSLDFRLPGKDYSGVVPLNAQWQGFITRQLAPSRGILPGTGRRSPFTAIREANVSNENWARRAVYLRHALPEYGKDIESLTKAKSAEERLPHVTNLVDRFLGNFTHGKFGDFAVSVPFIRWLAFITKLTLKDLPLHHPGRALALHQLGLLGNAAVAQEGIVNASLEGSIPVGGRDVRTQAINPFATISQLASFDPTSRYDWPTFAGIPGAINPFYQAAYTAMTGHEFQNPDFAPLASKDFRGHAGLALNELAGTLPAYSLAFGRPTFGVKPSGTSRLSRAFPQPQPSFLDRLFGYSVVGETPVNRQNMALKNFYLLEQNARARGGIR